MTANNSGSTAGESTIELAEIGGGSAQQQVVSNRSHHNHAGGTNKGTGGADVDDFSEQMQPLVFTNSKEERVPNDAAAGGPHDSSGSTGTASNGQVAVNIIISFVGAGLLGVPETFQRAGWLLGTVTLLVVAGLNIYAMLLLPKVRRELESKNHDSSNHGLPNNNSNSHNNDARNKNNNNKDDPVRVQAGSYSAIGRILLGWKGEIFVNVCLVISQCGFATAYIIFIAANMHNIAHVPRYLTCLAATPGLMLLVQANDMKTLSPFSLLADLANLLGLSAVFFQDFEKVYFQHNDKIHRVKWGGVLNVIAITIYSMEGIGLILSLENSCQDRSRFPRLLTTVVGGISVFMACFGTFSYMAFGDDTQAPITLNLQGSIAATFVKCALCLALYFTYPVMMFPVWSIIEESMFGGDTATNDDNHNAGNTGSSAANTTATSTDTRQKETTDTAAIATPSKSTKATTGASGGGSSTRIKKALFRCFVVCVTAFVAYTVPNFGHFLALVGSSICTMLGFILPCYFHLSIFGGFACFFGGSSGSRHNNSVLSWWEVGLDVFLMIGGGIFGIMGTYTSVMRMVNHNYDD